MKMREAMVQYPTKYGKGREVLETASFKRKIIQSKEQFKDYEERFPAFYTSVEPLFKRELADGNIIIINNNGGWCVPSDEIKIVKFL